MVPMAFGWRHLLFANWPVDPVVVGAHLPEDLSVQTHDGASWLTVLPFVNVDVRPRGLPAAAGVRVPEVNLRTYVTRDGEPGIYFFSLDAGSVLATVGARLTHHLPYYYGRIRLREREGRVQFASRRRHPGARPARVAASYRPAGEPFAAEPDSRAEFLVERRRLYTRATDGSLRYTDVSHERYTLYPVEASIPENTLFEANGFEDPDAEPTLYYSPGVDVVTTTSRRWDESRTRRRADAPPPGR